MDNSAICRVNDDCVSLGEILRFLVDRWKKLFIGACIGLLIGIGGWLGLARYNVEAVLLNNNALDIMSWRNLQTNLPILAGQLVEKKQVKPGMERQLDKMSKNVWWQKNVLPGYSLTEEDAKTLTLLGSNNKELPEFKQQILYFTVKTSGRTQDASKADLKVAIDFIRQGSAHILLKKLISEYELQILRNDGEVPSKITDIEVELDFLKERARNLETLRQHFPATAPIVTQQAVDLTESNAKFMPINTQMIAVNSEINKSVEDLSRLRNKLAQMKVLQDFVVQAQPIIARETDGLSVAEQLLQLEDEVRAKYAPGNDKNAQQVLDDIKSGIISVRARLSAGLIANSSPLSSRPSFILPATGGLFCGVFFMLIFLIGVSAFKKESQN